MRTNQFFRELISQASPSNLPKSLQPTLIRYIKVWVSTNNVLSMAYAKTCEKGQFSKITFHAI